MSSQKKLWTYQTISRLIIRLRDDLNNSDFVLLYAYNGTGKTRISMEFKEKGKKKKGIERDTLYFNAFTEDLFYWDNDLENDTERYLKFNEKSNFFNGFKELSLDNKIREYLNRYANFDFYIDYDEWKIRFSKNENDYIKISRGEENIFIWCIYLAICQLIIDKDETYSWVKYLYIDDPISSLDDNNAIAIASDLSKLLKEMPKVEKQTTIKTVISSHHGLFFNVMSNELKKMKHKQYFLHRDKSTDIYSLQSTTDTPFFHHISTLTELHEAIEKDKLYTYHFNMLRGILEKTAIFFGSDDFSYCINGIDDEILYARVLNLLSHGKYSVYEPREMVDDTKQLFKTIFLEFLKRYKFDLPKIFPEQNTQIQES